MEIGVWIGEKSTINSSVLRMKSDNDVRKE
jgi:hypothetical protein